MDQESIQRAISERDCEVLQTEDYNLYAMCKELARVSNGYDDIQTQIYIVSGVGGGVCLVLIILVIALFIKLSNGFNDLYHGDELAKRGYSTFTGSRLPPHASAPSDPTFGIPPPPPFSQNKGAGFDASTGGVRVLPRNPPTMMRNNNGPHNQGYY